MSSSANLEDLSGSTKRSLIVVHGRDFKPAEELYANITLAAIRSGIERDFPDQLGALDDIQKSVAWYGDLSSEILMASGEKYDEALDIGDRRNALKALRSVGARKKFGIRQYDVLPGKSALPEAITTIASPLLGSIGLWMPMIRSKSRDFALYLEGDSHYSSRVRERLRKQLCAALDRGDRIALLSHGTGSCVTYDVLWQLSNDAEFKDQYGDKKIELWVTLGSPLGDANVRKHLLAAKRKADNRYPVNVISWHNVAAEDDYTCHDNTLADDFRKMLEQRLVSALHDHMIFNLAVRYGKSNPHSSVGYFIHPRTAKILVDWLRTSDVIATPKHTF